MRSKLALLCYRVARWLAPSLFKWPDFTVKEMRAYQKRLAKEWVTMPAKQRYGSRGLYVQERLAAVAREVDRLEMLSPVYEEVKVEIAYNEVNLMTRAVRDKIKNDPAKGKNYYLREEAKRQLFAAVVAGFAQSKEIDLHLYFREVSADLRTIGIRLYLKHAK